MSGPSSPSNLSSVTLVGSTGSGGQDKSDDTPTEGTFKYGKAPTSPLPERVNPRAHKMATLATAAPPTPTICTTDTSQTEEEEPGQASRTPDKQQQPALDHQQHSPQHQQQQIKTPPTPPTVTTTPCYSPANGQPPNGAPSPLHQPLQQQQSLPLKSEQATIVQGRLEIGGPKIVTQPYLTTTTTTTVTITTTTTATSTKSISPPHLLPMDRRPSVGHNIAIPHAALCQHRHSLQLNGDGSLFSKVRYERLRSTHSPTPGGKGLEITRSAVSGRGFRYGPSDHLHRLTFTIKLLLRLKLMPQRVRVLGRLGCLSFTVPVRWVSCSGMGKLNSLVTMNRLSSC